MSGAAGEASGNAVPPGSVAVVGMAGRFPAASSVGELWQLLDQEREATRWLTDDELLGAGVSAGTLSDPAYVRAGLVLPDMEMFDAEFFGFSPREAAILDPQHRHFIECAWEALEDAGHLPERFAGSIGVFAGCGMQAYLAYNLLTNPELLESVGLFLLRHTGNDKDFLTTRVSYLLNLQGPSVSVQTACSTSLVAVHLACQSLLSGGCDMALAGGVSIEIPHRRGYRFAEGEILSPDGHCRAFDEDAKGTLFGSGVGVAVLRRLEDALASGDNIHAVIRGSAINNDGSQKAGYLAPSVDGQARAAAEALAVADVDPSSVSYIEAHGTGTAVGDPIELAALAQAYGAGTGASPCGVGSIKTNIGHLDTAAGVASLIKVALALRHGKIPASLNYRRPNSRFDLSKSCFYVVNRGRPWPRGNAIRRAAVNSLGVGGTNAHVILEEPPPRVAQSVERDCQLLVLSARSEPALERLKKKWRRFVDDPPEEFTIPDAAFTSQAGRRAFDHRCAIVARDLEGLRSALDGRETRHAVAGVRSPAPRVVFMFPGGGAQYPGAARELYERVPAFRDAVDECFGVMPAAVPDDLRSLMFERAPDDVRAVAALEQPVRALAALFVLEYAFAALWRAWGVRPATVIGHSAGEYVAAVLAGVMALPDALSIVVLRGQIFERMEPGGMLSVQMPEAELRPLLGDELDLAAVNASDLCVASGPVPAIEALEVRLRAKEIEPRRVRINVAAHSRLLDSHLDLFSQRIRNIRLGAPQIPFVSTLLGTPVGADELAQSEYWVRHLRQTVRFADGLHAVLAEPGAVLLEVGPGQALSAFARLARGNHRPAAIVASCRKAEEPDSDLACALVAAGRLWTAGQELDWEQVRGGGGFRRISLPTYAFERQRHWIEPGMPQVAEAAKLAADGLRRLDDMEDWFRIPDWRAAPLAPAAADRTRHCLVFAGGAPLGTAVERALRTRGAAFDVVRAGQAFGRSDDGGWVIDSARPDDYARLLSELDAAGVQPEGIFFLWALDAPPPPVDDPQAAQAHIFEPLFCLSQALQRLDLGSRIHLSIAASGTLAVADEPVTHPERATLLGPCRAAAREIPLVSAQVVDLDADAVSGDPGAAHLVAEFDAQARDEIVAYRGNERWVQDTVRARPAPSGRCPPRLTPGGVYVITGGLGGIGLELARFIAAETRGRLALIGRRVPPPRSEWPRLAASRDTDAKAECARRLREIEAAGAEVLPLSADVTDAGQMRRALDEVQRRFGRINGVFHAAGVLEDAPLAGKTVEDTRRVMAPKVGGAAILDKLLPPGSVDVFAAFSSTSVNVGTPGQVDYIAANAYLEALAASRPDGFAIVWGIWGDIGMAARRYGISAPAAPAGAASVHPLLGAAISRSDQEMAFEATLHRHALWVLDEHVVGDRAVLPGMAYIEVARAAMAVIRPGPIEIANLSIVAPLAFHESEARIVRTSLTARQGGGGFDFAVQSRTLGPDRTDGGGWTAHAHARARFIESAAADITAWALPAVDPFGPSTDRPEPPQAGAVSFGPRWRNVLSQRLGADGGIAEIELDGRFAGDLATFGVHPAMADMAATFGLALVKPRTSPGRLFLPMSVERARIAAPFPQRLTSCCRLTKETPDSFATFDVACTDAEGKTLATFEGFSLRCIDAATAARPPAAHGRGTRPVVEQLLAAGIRSTDAPAVFRRAFATPERRVIVASVALPELRRVFSLSVGAGATAKPRRARPPSEAYANETEARIAGCWTELLGVERVAPEDDFFALGGHSLAAVRLFVRIRKQFGVDLPLASLFEAPTLRQLAKLVATRAGGGSAPDREAPAPNARSAQNDAPAGQERDDWTPLVTINRGDVARPPFFCVHGGGGNVLIFGDLSRRLGADQPFYGLQASGVDGRRPPLPTVEAMAESYLAAIREVRPAGPYLLGGYSGGGVIAFEMAHRLTREGQRVALLVLFDSVSPLIANRDPSQLRRWDLEHMLRRPARRIVGRLSKAWQRHDLPAEQDVLEAKRALIREHVARAQMIPEELRDIYLYDSYMEAQRLYQPMPLSVPVLLFRATEQELPYAGERMLGWEQLITGPIELHDIESDHLGLMSPKNAERMCAALRARLDDAAHLEAASPPSPRPGADAHQIAAE